MVETISPKADFLIEICLQVVNSLGGVNTVITSKSLEMKEYYGENFYAVGPYFKKTADVEFEEQTHPREIGKLITQLKKEKIIVHYGKWLIPGSPKTFLIDFSGRLNRVGDIKKDMKAKYGIDFSKIKFREKDFIAGFSMKAFESELVWGDAAKIFVQRLLALESFRKKRGVLHFHFSDPSGFIMADLRKKNARVGLVATTHACRLGRAIALNGEDLHKEVELGLKRGKTVNKGREKKYGGICTFKHYMELMYAKCCDVFTSVSEITAKESKYILGRKPDIITPNGLEMSKYPNLEERAVLHHASKEKIYRFLNAYFLPYYPIDIRDSLLFFTSGRYEPRTKGYDILIEALHKLNERLKKEKFEKNIFVFLFIMTPLVKRPKKKVLENLSVYKTIESTIKNKMPDMEKKIISCLVHRKAINMQALFDPFFISELRKLMLKFRRVRGETAQMRAFVGLGKTDVIIEALKYNNLTNKKKDKVRVIFYPAPVSVADGLLSMDYSDVIRAMHLGIFPSLYEPWGYTPHETTANSIITVTTDAAGFGKFIQRNVKRSNQAGVYVLKVMSRKREDIVNDLYKHLYDFVKLSRQERIERKLEARNLVSLADWKEFSKYYIKAHNLAISKCRKRRKSKKR